MPRSYWVGMWLRSEPSGPRGTTVPDHLLMGTREGWESSPHGPREVGSPVGPSGARAQFGHRSGQGREEEGWTWE